MTVREDKASNGGLALIGLFVAGAMAAMMLPRLWPKARMAVRRTLAAPYVDPGGGGAEPQADPARGEPA